MKIYELSMSRMMVASALMLAIWTVKAQSVEYVHTDSQGTPVAITNEAGVVVEKSEYEPYGNVLNRPVSDGPSFAGHVQDAATNLTYMQQRYYDQQLGVFVSADPIAAQSNSTTLFNRYRYANDNPTSLIDPDGRQAGTKTECGRPACQPKPEEKPSRPPPPNGCGTTRSCYYDGKKWRTITTADVAYWQRVYQNFKDANKAVPGLLAPTGLGLATGGVTGRATGLPTLLDAAKGSWRMRYVTMEIIPALVNAGINTFVIGVSWEGGLFVGSLINAAEVPGSNVTYRDWYSNELCRITEKCG